MKKTSGTLLLLLTALIWGTAFVAQRTGMDHLGPIAFQSIRALLGFLSLLPLMLLRKRAGKSGPMPTVKASLSCGAVLAVASTVQQIGLQYTTASKAGFISSLYVVLVPLIGLLLGRKPEKGVWIGVPLSVLGMYLIARYPVRAFSLGPGRLADAGQRAAVCLSHCGGRALCAPGGWRCAQLRAVLCGGSDDAAHCVPD